MPVVLDHAVGVDAQAGDPLRLRLEVRPDVHPGPVPPDEEGLALVHGGPHECFGRVEELLVHRLHPLRGQRASVLDALLADHAEAGILGRVLLRRRPGVHDPARAELRGERRIVWIVRIFRFLLGIEVVEVAQELVEAVDRWQELVAVAEVVLAEPAGGVAERLEQLGDGRVFRLQAEVGTGKAHLGETGADRRLAREERRAAGGATVLPVPVGEDRPLAADAVDAGGAVAHDPVAVGADIEPADVVTPHDENIGQRSLGRSCFRTGVLGVDRRRQPGVGCRRCCGRGERSLEHAAASQPQVPGIVSSNRRMIPGHVLSVPFLPAGEFYRCRTSHSGTDCLTTQRKPMWLMPVSMSCGCRAAGR